MRRKFFLVKIFIIYLFLVSIVTSKELSYYNQGKKLFQKKDFDKSKILFEKDIVFNPKSENSYLYLAKIFYEKDNNEEQEINLNSVLLLNPQNDEAIYLLTLLKIKQSDYNKAKELIDRFNLVCKSFCSKKREISEKLNKLSPENAEKKN